MNWGQFLSDYFSVIWSIFQLRIPVIDITFGSFFIGSFVIGLSVFFLHLFFGFGGSGSELSLSTVKSSKKYERRN